MFVPFENLPATARIWVYPSNRKFSDEEAEKIGTLCRSFLEQWTAHGQGLKASFSLPYNQFIVIALDEAQHPPRAVPLMLLFILYKIWSDNLLLYCSIK